MRGNATGHVAGILLILTGFPIVSRAADLPALRYQWQTGETYIYSVSIKIDGPTATETLQGRSIYHARPGENGGFILTHTGHLTERQESKAGRRRPRPPTHISRFSPFRGVGAAGIGNRTEIQTDVFGHIAKVRGESQLPFLLGDLSHLVIVPLSPEGKSTWEVTEKFTIQEIRSDNPRLPRTVEKTNHPGKEHSVYTLGKSDDATVQIKKTYELATEEKEGESPYLEMTGNGTITFDVKAGVPKAMDFQGTVKQNAANISLKVPLSLHVHLLEGEEKERILAAAKEAKEAREAGKQAKEGGKPAAATDSKQALADLKSGNNFRARAAATKLARAEPSEDRSEIAAALEELCKSKDNFTRDAAAKALAIWATKENVPTLLRLLDDTSVWVRNAAMEALGKLQDDRGAEPVARHLSRQEDRMTAGKALQAMGPAAESAVAACLENPEWSVRLEACRILKVIGTKRSAAKLRELAHDENGLVATAAKDALAEASGRD